MKLNREALRSMILSEIKQLIKEERDESAAKEYLEKRKDPGLSDEAKKSLRDQYKISNIEDVKIGERSLKRFFFKTNPVDIDVTPKKEEN